MTVASTAKAVTFVHTRSREKAKAFYGGVLGFRLKGDDEYASVFDMNGVELRITEIGDHTAGAHPVLGWEVKDLVAAIKDLRAKGVAMNIYPGFGQDELGVWTSPDGKTRIAFFNDQDGNGLTLKQA